MKMIRVRYRGPSETLGSRLIADDGEASYMSRSLNALEMELEERGYRNSYADCCKLIAEYYIDERWDHVSLADVKLLHGTHGKEDYFLVLRDNIESLFKTLEIGEKK